MLFYEGLEEVIFSKHEILSEGFCCKVLNKE